MPLSAPVARDAPGLGGQRVADARQVTLSPEERQIARNSFTDPGMSNEQKELLYAQNKVQISAAHGVGRVHRREASAVTRRRHPGWLDAPQVWVPLVACDDYEVRGFLEAEFLNFCMDVLSADEAFQAARAVFGDRRCESVEFWTH